MHDKTIIAIPARLFLLTADDLSLVRQDEGRERAPMQNVMTGEPGRPAPAPGLAQWRAIATRFGRLAGALMLRLRHLELSGTL